MSTAPEVEPASPPLARSKPAFLRRVKIRGYKSIAFCDVTLEPLTILVGRNASGKSNFLDALAFLKDIFDFNLPEAVRRHGGVNAIRFRDSAGSNEIDFWLELELPVPVRRMVGATRQNISLVSYRLTIASDASEEVRITREEVTPHGVQGVDFLAPSREALSRVITSALPKDDVQDYLDKMYPSDKPLAGLRRNGWMDVGLGAFLRNIGVYNFVPDAIRAIQRANPSGLLARSGQNIPDVLRRLRSHDPKTVDRLTAYLAAITDHVVKFDSVSYGEFDTVRFHVQTKQHAPPSEFDAASMSDGTLRAMAALVAAFQITRPHDSPNLVAIEEPETSLHPAAMRALVDALDEATLRTQILLTTHSADMLDNPTIRPENIRVVEMIDGETRIAPVDAASVEIVQQKLDTLGGLERQNQLQPDLDDLERQRHLSKNGPEPKG